jgi:hypothetical protein
VDAACLDAVCTGSGRNATSTLEAVVREPEIVVLVFDPQNLPGLLQSPAGSLLHRVSILFLAAELTGIALIRWDGSPLPRVFAMGAKHHAAVNAQLDAADAGPLERIKHGT